MLVVVKYLGDNLTRNGINQIEDWYLPSDAFKTKFTDEAGRTLYLVGTREQIIKEDAKLSRDGVVNYDGHVHTYTGPKAAPKPVVVTAKANTVITSNT
jgi:hypothetical protein